MLGSEAYVFGQAGTGMWNIDFVSRSKPTRQYNLSNQEWNLEPAERNPSTLLGPEGSVAKATLFKRTRACGHRHDD